MSFAFSIPSLPDPIAIRVESGSSLIFVGANGGGKTRLAVHIEMSLGEKAHRISAHRALNLNPKVPKISESSALQGLRLGSIGDGIGLIHRPGNRWRSNMATGLLNDFDFLVQALFADQANKSLVTHNRVRAGNLAAAELTKFEWLATIWERLLPHRKLAISGDDIEVSTGGSEKSYNASEMSDGERAIFYMIGQTLTAAANSLLIVDEPELHVHRSIMSKLWDELEAARTDCGFVFITHDLEFAASRVAQKFVMQDYRPTPTWVIEAVPANSGFSEEIATLILGSRRPILFVEGTEGSLDAAIYRCCYPDWTVIPRGSCEDVLHSVVTMRKNANLTRVTCCGIVDADDYQTEDVDYLRNLGVAVLPVSEIENVILMPAVSRAIAVSEGFQESEIANRLSSLQSAIFDSLSTAKAIDAVVTRYVKRRIDRLLKKIDLKESENVAEITAEYGRQTGELDVTAIAKGATDRIKGAIRSSDLPALLANYDNKALLALAAKHLKQTKLSSFESWLLRVLRNDKIPELTAAVRISLPSITPR